MTAERLPNPFAAPNEFANREAGIEGNAYSSGFQRQPLAPPVPRPPRLGLVPRDHLTLREVTSQLLQRLFERYPDKRDEQRLTQEAFTALAYTLVSGKDLEALVMQPQTGELYRVPGYCWSAPLRELTNPDWMMGRLFEMFVSDCLQGRQFGANEGRTAFFPKAEAKAFIETAVSGRAPATADEPAPALEGPKPNVPFSGVNLTAWLKREDVNRTAASRIDRDGGDSTDERLLRDELMAMLKEQNRTVNEKSLKSLRNDLGYQVGNRVRG